MLFSELYDFWKKLLQQPKKLTTSQIVAKWWKWYSITPKISLTKTFRFIGILNPIVDKDDFFKCHPIRTNRWRFTVVHKKHSFYYVSPRNSCGVGKILYALKRKAIHIHEIQVCVFVIMMWLAFVDLFKIILQVSFFSSAYTINKLTTTTVVVDVVGVIIIIIIANISHRSHTKMLHNIWCPRYIVYMCMCYR